MVSCTEFIPLYSELFKFIEEKADHDAVVRFWEYISDEYVSPTLSKEIEESGLDGVWDHWNKVFTEEACDVRYEYDTDKQAIWMDMRHCPSKGMLLDLAHMEPYHDYCGHCKVLYSRIFNKYGISSEDDHSDVAQARCKTHIYIKQDQEKP